MFTFGRGMAAMAAIESYHIDFFGLVAKHVTHMTGGSSIRGSCYHLILETIKIKDVLHRNT